MTRFKIKYSVGSSVQKIVGVTVSADSVEEATRLGARVLSDKGYEWPVPFESEVHKDQSNWL